MRFISCIWTCGSWWPIPISNHFLLSANRQPRLSPRQWTKEVPGSSRALLNTVPSAKKALLLFAHHPPGPISSSEKSPLNLLGIVDHALFHLYYHSTFHFYYSHLRVPLLLLWVSIFLTGLSLAGQHLKSFYLHHLAQCLAQRRCWGNPVEWINGWVNEGEDSTPEQRRSSSLTCEKYWKREG